MLNNLCSSAPLLQEETDILLRQSLLLLKVQVDDGRLEKKRALFHLFVKSRKGYDPLLIYLESIQAFYCLELHHRTNSKCTFYRVAGINADEIYETAVSHPRRLEVRNRPKVSLLHHTVKKTLDCLVNDRPVSEGLGNAGQFCFQRSFESAFQGLHGATLSSLDINRLRDSATYWLSALLSRLDLLLSDQPQPFPRNSVQAE